MSPFDANIGCFMIGAMMEVLLCGIVSSQTLHYFRTFPSDKFSTKVMVACLSVLTLCLSAMGITTIWIWCVTNNGKVEILETSPATFSLEPAITAVVASIVHAYFANKVYLLSKSKTIPILIIAVSSIQLGWGVGASAEVYVLDSQFNRFQTWTYGVSVWLASAGLADILITASLIYCLKKYQTDYSRTKSIIGSLLRNAIETNGLTLVFALTNAALFGASPTAAYIVPQLCLSQLYFNSLLVSLNSRATFGAIKNTSNHQVSYSSAYGDNMTLPARPQKSSRRTSSNTLLPTALPIATAIEVEMTETVEVEGDPLKGNLSSSSASASLKSFDEHALFHRNAAESNW